MNKFLFGALMLLFSQSALAQSFYDESTIQTIEITFAQSNWDQLLDNAYATTGDYIMATTVTINGMVFDSVGVKYKGNSTYTANQVKNPFHIELDTYKEQDYQGYSDIKLSNVKNDPSFVREVLSYKIGRQYMDAPLSNYANVTVNGTLIGLYVSSESVSKTFLKSHFDSKNNTFVKCNPPAGAGPGTSDYPNLVYLGTDSSLYYDAYELKSPIGWNELINLCDTLKNNTADVSEILDVDRALWMLAFDNVLVNLDSYLGAFAQNYYLYRDDFDRFIPIIWDMNESFGKFSMLGSGNLNSTTQKQQMSHLLNATDVNYPLVSELLSIPMYKRMYLAHVKTILLENFSNNSYFTSAQAMQSTIDAAVQADPNKFYTYANFTSNLTTDLVGGPGPGGGSTPGISNLMDARSTYLLSQSDFTQTEPTISNMAVSNATPNLNEVVDFITDVANGPTVYLGYRTQAYAPFERVLMFDDGLHNDGAANDGKFGVSVPMTTTFFQYYFYAENTGIGKFSPVRAEHEYYSLTLASIPAGDIVINELLASNATIQADQDGEFDDWIEIHNNTNAAVDLSSYYLTDDATNLSQWQFPSGTSIPANGYLIVWADKDTLQVGLHANFKLSATGETVYLLDGSTMMDQVVFGAQAADISFGRYPNGTGAFATMIPTFSALNSDVSLSVATDEMEESTIVLFPNPTATNFQLKGCPTEWTGKNITIYSMEGKQVYNAQYEENLVIDVQEWNSGIYFLNLEDYHTKVRVLGGM